ncbi:MAG: YkgJ family cysteine cluster protein [Promethearchaeota archaeon]
MSDNTKDNKNDETKNEEKKEKVSEVKSEEKKDEDSETKKEKTKFTFKCIRDDKCCLSRGPIPITFWDLELWARNGVVANFMPYLEIYTKPDGSFDLILKPLPPPKEGSEASSQEDPFKETPIEELLEEKCPLYSKEQKKCLVYNNRPLSCRTYPLEFDGKNFSVVDVECPGIGQEGMTKEELKEMRETAKTMNYELTRIRIALPVLNQIITRKIMTDLMKQQMETMSKLSEEDKKKLDEILGKSFKKEPNPA